METAVGTAAEYEIRMVLWCFSGFQDCSGHLQSRKMCEKCPRNAFLNFLVYCDSSSAAKESVKRMKH